METKKTKTKTKCVMVKIFHLKTDLTRSEIEVNKWLEMMGGKIEIISSNLFQSAMVIFYRA